MNSKFFEFTLINEIRERGREGGLDLGGEKIDV